MDTVQVRCIPLAERSPNKLVIVRSCRHLLLMSEDLSADSAWREAMRVGKRIPMRASISLCYEIRMCFTMKSFKPYLKLQSRIRWEKAISSGAPPCRPFATVFVPWESMRRRRRRPPARVPARTGLTPETAARAGLRPQHLYQE